MGWGWWCGWWGVGCVFPRRPSCIGLLCLWVSGGGLLLNVSDDTVTDMDEVEGGRAVAGIVLALILSVGYFWVPLFLLVKGF